MFMLRRPRVGWAPDPFRQEGFRRRIAVEDRVLGALLVIDHELQREPRLARPSRMRRLGAIADHVARIRFGHRSLSRLVWRSHA